MSYHYNSRVIQDGLVLCLDAGDKISHPGTTAWNDLSGKGNNGTLTSAAMGFSDSGYNIQYGINNATEDAFIISSGDSNTLTNGQIFLIDSEQVLVGNFTNMFGSYPRFSITRGHNSTTATSHSAGTDLFEAGTEISFDGNSQIANVGDIGDVFGMSFTVDLWIYPTEIDDRQEFIGQKVNNQNWWRFGIDELDNWEIDVEVGDSRVVSLNPDFNLVADTWQHVVLSRDSSNWNFYLNGALDATASDEDTIPDMAADVKIGRPIDSPYEGKMSSVKVYDRSLSATEISQNFNAHRGRFGV